MSNKTPEKKKAKPNKFQILFLHNDASQDVEVHELGKVDFSTVQSHLEQGESVFITSKISQKINASKFKKELVGGAKMRLVTGFCLDKT